MKNVWHTAETIVTEFEFDMDKHEHPTVSIMKDSVKFDWSNMDSKTSDLVSISVCKAPRFSNEDGGKIWLGYFNESKNECYEYKYDGEIDDLIRSIARVKYFDMHWSLDETFLKEHER